jgi:hypothetical protein
MICRCADRSCKNSKSIFVATVVKISGVLTNKGIEKIILLLLSTKFFPEIGASANWIFI